MKIMPGYHSKIHVGYRGVYWLPQSLAVGCKMNNIKIFAAETPANDSKRRGMPPSLSAGEAGGLSAEQSPLIENLYITHQSIPNIATLQLKLRFPSASPRSPIWNRDGGPSSHTISPASSRNPQGNQYEGPRVPKPFPNHTLRNDSTILLMSGNIETNPGPRPKVPLEEQGLPHM